MAMQTTKSRALEASAKDYASVEKIFRQILQHTPYAKTAQNRLKKRRQSMPVDVLESPSTSSTTNANGRQQRRSPSPRCGNGATASPSPSSSLANLLGQAATTGGRGSLPLIKSRKGGANNGAGHSTPPSAAHVDHHQKNA
uniref:Uncharacterized protein n=1 Tax=Romanomermis culicivorax TaxID=13658 RepID=A0A915HWW3_ROMCU